PDLQPRPCSPPGPRQVPLVDPAAQSGCSSAARRKIPPAKAPALAATLLPSHLLPTEIRQSPASSKGQCHQVTLSRNAGFLKEITQVKGDGGSRHKQGFCHFFTTLAKRQEPRNLGFCARQTEQHAQRLLIRHRAALCVADEQGEQLTGSLHRGIATIDLDQADQCVVAGVAHVQSLYPTTLSWQRRHLPKVQMQLAYRFGHSMWPDHRSGAGHPP